VLIATTESHFKNLKNGYEDPSQLGVDRWLAMIATEHLNSNRIIIDAGSWISMDVIAPNGQHLGGTIISKNKDDEAALLKRFQLKRDTSIHDSIFGTSTFECIHLAKGQYDMPAITSILICWLKYIAKPCRIFISGGNATAVEKAIMHKTNPQQDLILDIQQNENLVLSGLSIRYSQNLS